MAKNSKPFDVFISFNHPDKKHAAAVADVLRSYGLVVFFDPQEIKAGETTEGVIWDAMAESHALVVVVPENAPSSWMAVELGAARAWNKPIFAISAKPTVGRPPAAFQHIQILPLSRSDEIAQSINSSREPISDDDQKRLGESYQKIGVTVDQLALQPHHLAKLIKDFNRRSGKKMSGEQVMSLLLRLRKRRALPALEKRQSSSVT